MIAWTVGAVDSFLDVPLDLNHFTPFRRRVYEACRRIPYGRTMTYAELAKKAGSPRAFRAVGSTMACNRLPLIVPCHRVVASGGKIGGFSAPDGISMKERLLLKETRSYV